MIMGKHRQAAHVGICLIATLHAAMAISLMPNTAVAKSNVQKVCQDHVHEGFASNRIYDRAFLGALKNWKDITTAHDGASWANIDRGAPVQCEKQLQNSATWWECTVIYRPCRMVPADLPATAPVPDLTVQP